MSENESAQASPILTLSGISVRFGGLRAVSDVSLSVERNEILGLIGPNGAGKSTLTNVISGRQRSHLGRVYYCDRDITSWPTHRRAQAGLLRTFQQPRLFPDISLLETLSAGTYIHGSSGLLSGLFQGRAARRDEASAADAARHQLQRLGLADKEQKFTDLLGSGEQRVVSLGAAELAKPTLLVLDEPMAGLSDFEISSVVAQLRSLHRDGVTIVLIDHHLDIVMSVCTRVAVLDQGELIAVGNAEQIAADERVRASYTGVADVA